MKSRIEDKMGEIENYLGELSEIMPEDFEEYKNDLKTKAACERYFEKIVEAVVDLAFLVIKHNALRIPEEDKQAFDILLQKEIIPEGLADRLKDAKGMRNIISHEYGKIDDEVVFHSITEEVAIDTEEFIEFIKKSLR